MTRLIGHQEVVALLRRAIAGGRASHAYLFTGPRGVGRRTLGVELAKALNCLASPDQRPCEACRQCRLIERGVHPDVRLVKRSPDRKIISLRAQSAPTARNYADSVEFIQSDAQLRPADGRAKVYLILNAEELGADAANRLLKTLEEPASFVHFVLSASDRGAVLPTIASRCQEVRLLPMPRAELARALVDERLANEETAAMAAALASGRPGRALQLVRDPDALEVYRADVGDLHRALVAGRLERLQAARLLVDRWSSQPEAVRGTLRTWAAWWRDVLLLQLGLAQLVAPGAGASRESPRHAADRVPPAAVREALRHVQGALQDLEANVNPRLTLDLLLLRLPTPAP